MGLVQEMELEAEFNEICISDFKMLKFASETLIDARTAEMIFYTDLIHNLSRVCV